MFIAEGTGWRCPKIPVRFPGAKFHNLTVSIRSVLVDAGSSYSQVYVSDGTLRASARTALTNACKQKLDVTVRGSPASRPNGK